ncbi:hypothetical protein CVT24_000402 [Panaeolus cyanescens]|uniref:DUF6532 domain-containing protein n=1 Tax=Panaeolus cyanescens TaxID=181874 RepID=A0A409YDM4_9AGAR|nr:hypothetical protein CVT24_000402 [Panaeolus cyanescens]
MSSPSDGRVHKTRGLQKKTVQTTNEKATGRSHRKAKETAVKKMSTTESTKKTGYKRRSKGDTDSEEDGGQDERPKKKTKSADRVSTSKQSGQSQKRVASRRQVIQSEEEVTASDSDPDSNSEASNSEEESVSSSTAGAGKANTSGGNSDDDDDDEDDDDNKEDKSDGDLGALFDSEMPLDVSEHVGSDTDLPSRIFEDTTEPLFSHKKSDALDNTDADTSPPSSKKTKADVVFNDERPQSVTTHKILSKNDKKKSRKAGIQTSQNVTKISTDALKSESSFASSSSDTIGAQTPEVQQVIHEGILLVEKDLLTVHAWPEHLKTDAYRRKVLRKAAKAWAHKSPSYASVKEQLEVDPAMVRLMGKLVIIYTPCTASIHSHFWPSWETEAGKAGLAPFRLGVGPDCAARVAALTAGHVYVYPGKWNIDEVKLPDGSVVEKPIWVPDEYARSGNKRLGQAYLNDAIPSLIIDAMFGELPNWGHRHQSVFQASNPDYPDEPEAPISLIALAATALYAALKSWTNGTPTKGRFSGDAYRAVFKKHESTLLSFKDTAPYTFHHIMHSLYKKVCPNNGTVAGGEDSGPLLTIDMASLD